jgi:hypothetical protein
MSIDINVHISADGALVNALSDIAGCLAAVSMARTGNTQTPLPEKTVTPPKEEEAAAPLGKPMTAKEEKAVNDILSVPAPSDPKPSEEETAKREKLKALFTKAAVAGKQIECKKLLKELGVTRQSQIPADKLDEALKKVEAL